MDNISQLELLACLRFVTKLDGPILSAKLIMDLLKSWCGQLMELYAQELAETEMLFLEKLLTSKSLIITGRLT